MGCGDTGFLDGGTIQRASIINSQIVNSEIQASKLDSSAITNLTEVDEASAKKIADAIAALPPDQLTALINALVQKPAIMPATPPVTTENNSVPTELYGEREIGMGAPAMWAQYGDNFVIPLYDKR